MTIFEIFLPKNLRMSKKSCTFAPNLENNIINPQIERKKTMARKRNCEQKSHLAAKGSALVFIGAAKSDKLETLKKALEWPLHVVVKGNDLFAYFQDDWCVDELEYQRRYHKALLGELISKGHVKTMQGIVLANVLPETLPLQGGKTWEEIYERSLESTERDESGMKYTSRRVGSNYTKKDEEGELEPAIVRVFSTNEYRTNGHF